MANKIVTMSKLKRAFQMLAVRIPQRQICEQLHMGRGVLARYKNAADTQHLGYGDAGRMSEEELEKFFGFTKSEAGPTEQRSVMDNLVFSFVYDLSHNRYLTVQKLHEEYRKKYPDGYGYTQFKKVIREYQYAHNLSFHNTYLPGDEMQIDFAGDALWITDRKTGEPSKAVVLVCVLPYSGLGFIKALPDASMEHFFGGISDAFTYFGGTTRNARSDNMKQWVRKHDRYEPVFNDAAVEWAAYYDTNLVTCRVRTPRDKGPVEGLVQKVYNAVYAEIHDEVFYDMASLNSRISELMDAFNCKPSKTSGKSRMDIFASEERLSLGDLPETPYRFRYRKTVKLGGNYHVQVGERKYSVPYQYVGRQLNVVWDLDTVEIYLGARRLAVHQRSGRDKYSTLDEHMPPNHLEYQHSKGYNAAYFLEQAELVGPCTKDAMAGILSRDRHVVRSYGSCKGVLSLRRAYGRERLENASRRLAGCTSITYSMLKNILSKNLDKAEKSETVSRVPENDYVRGPEAFNI